MSDAFINEDWTYLNIEDSKTLPKANRRVLAVFRAGTVSRYEFVAYAMRTSPRHITTMCHCIEVPIEAVIKWRDAE